ncbi:hypothetical protein [Ilumatobacter nonamiensis]|uniref:hypothetical protein n=1 Tax=Ilumatobacter nonamiensis TaxID=467093 RepID=UPI000348DCF3|nr:hypothetical protein [Ilumatobacter nonamiensis]
MSTPTQPTPSDDLGSDSPLGDLDESTEESVMNEADPTMATPAAAAAVAAGVAATAAGFAAGYAAEEAADG